MCSLLVIAGEVLDHEAYPSPGCHYLDEEENRFCLEEVEHRLCLMCMCRKIIHNHLMNLNRVNLFYKVARLGVPASIARFLLYGKSLDDDEEEEEEEGGGEEEEEEDNGGDND